MLTAVTRDISDRKVHEAKLLNTRDEAESASRLELASALGGGTTATILLPYDGAGESREASLPRLKVSAA